MSGNATVTAAATPRRFFCVGLDGGTWTILRPLVAAGHMPNLAGLMAQGRSGVLRSTIPPITPAAWSTFMTGCNPGKHGVFDFQGHDRTTHQSHFINATSLRMPTLWQLLSQHGKRVAVVDLPVTYPLLPINGVMVSGLMTPGRHARFVHPPELLAELEQHLGYPWPLLKEEEERGRIHDDFQGFLTQMHRFLVSRTEAMLHLLQRESWDVAFLQMQCLDFLQHPLWKHLEAGHPAHEPERHREVVARFFAALDEALGRLLAAVARHMAGETLVLLLSDHGFQRHRTRAELNHWLHQHGFLVPARTAGSWVRWAEHIRKLDVFKLRKRWLPKSRRNALGNALHAHRIDYARSRFFAVSSFWGYLYRGPQATEQDLAALVAELAEWRDPETGEHVVRQVHRSEEIYHGEALSRLPDLIVEPAPGYTFASKTYFNHGPLLVPVAGDDFHVGTHAREGMYLAAGPGIATAGFGQAEEADLQDMMPTILHWLGLPVPNHCDGRVRTEWLTGAQRQAEVLCHEAELAVAQELVLSAGEQQEIERRLQGLGYL